MANGTVNIRDQANLIWSIAELLRGDYKQAEYGKVILPFTVLRRLDCVLEPTKEKVLASLPKIEKTKVKNREPVLNSIAKQSFHNTSKYDFPKLLAEPDQLAKNLRYYISAFSTDARDILDNFSFEEQIARLDKANLLYLVMKRFAEFDLHPSKVDNTEMGYLFEELIRKFSEISNETAGEHFTPREVIRLMVNLLFLEDRAVLTKRGIVKTLYDPACGTGGMLSVAEEYLGELNPDATLVTFGQELNEESYAICKSDMLIKGHDVRNVKLGNSFSNDQLRNEQFDYMLSNPPFGVDWKKVEKVIVDEHEKLGFNGRFGAGLPRINDGSLLFLQHMISKMKHDNGGSRIAIIFNGSPLFTGSAGSGEGEIRKWLIEKDMVEAIVGLPDQLFYNTGISTYLWIVTNRKTKHRKGKIQLIDARQLFVKMRKSLGNKRNEIGDGKDGKPDQIAEITRLYGDFQENDRSKILENEDFGYRQITVERPFQHSYQITTERIELLKTETGFQNLAKSKKHGTKAAEEIEQGKTLQDAVLRSLASHAGQRTWKSQAAFTKYVEGILNGADPPPGTSNAIVNAFGEHDETAETLRDRKGHPEADPDLRDTETVPLKEDVKAYFAREVLPHVPHAWIAETKTKVGYEIPFTRAFYRYEPPRPLAEIEADIKALENDILKLLREVTS
jgi:type I restriction enzyme M protein